ncbi:Tungsten-containing aldehyde ferredoxin oxidoreductase [Nymphon striatum]|nr:Tungsten-containing aldehyde ferredoxin oxidoreductase [Nymphon striatum]
MERQYNNAAGFTSDDDTLPKRLLKEAIKSGPTEGQVNRLGEMLPIYYEVRGWTPEGVPTAETLERHAVENVDTDLKELTTDDGTKITYDKLLIAAGSKPLLPPIEGADLPNVHNCWTIEDARQIAERSNSCLEVVLMGRRVYRLYHSRITR